MVHRFLSIVTNVGFAVGELWAWTRGNRRRVRVSGRSMLPTLSEGDHILIRTATPSVGDIIVVDHPDPERSTLLVKRLDSALPSGALVLRSDNPDEGTDSRSFGPVAAESVLGVATLRLSSLRQLRPIGRGF